MENIQNDAASTDSTDSEQVDPGLELKLLKQRADMMGITYSNNISKEKLQAKIDAKMNGEEQKPAEPEQTINALAPVTNIDPRAQLIEDEMKLVRVRITNLDPKKKNLPGEILTLANEVLGTVRKFIPFGEVTDNGYHVPQCLYRMMDERKFLDIRTRKKDGKTYIEQRWAKEFALEVLPQLTPQELARLATAQIAAGTVEVDTL